MSAFECTFWTSSSSSMASRSLISFSASAPDTLAAFSRALAVPSTVFAAASVIRVFICISYTP